MDSTMGPTANPLDGAPRLAEWERVSLSKVFKLSSGESRPDDLSQVQDSSHPYPVFGGNGVLGYAAQYFVEQPTIVLGRVGEKCGCVHIAPSRSWISDNALYAKVFLRPVDLTYLASALLALGLNRLKRKSSQPLITQGIVHEQTIALPPLPEQRAIAMVLRTVQRAKEATEKVLTATKQLKQSLLRHLFTYGPVPFDQADKVPLKETTFGRVSNDWQMVSPAALFKLSSGDTRPKHLLDAPSGENLFPVFGGNGIMGYAPEFMTKRETIVLGRVGAYCGAVHVAPPRSWISDNALYTKQFLRDFDLGFVATALEILDLNRFQKKSGQPLITHSIVNDQLLPLPDETTQKEITAQVLSADAKLQAETGRHRALTTLFNTLLHHLMTGKVRVV